MLEARIYERLTGDSALVGYLNTFQGEAAIFSEVAPEGAKMPYLVFRVNRRQETGHKAIEIFEIFIDFWGYNGSRVDSRLAMQRVEFLLDEYTFHDDEDYDSIRVDMENGRATPEKDAREIHYETEFSARAGRKAWAEQL